MAPLPDPTFWRGKRVFLTGHSGFVGGWTGFWLSELGAEVTGYALPPPSNPSFFALTRLQDRIRHIEGDVRDAAALETAMRAADPEILLHLAAQPIVRRAYRHPVESFAVNVMGTAHTLEAARGCPNLATTIVFTTDKVYRNRETGQAYREDDELGGDEPYSASKSGAELVAEAYRNRYLGERGGLACVRAGNIIGGGDWAQDRLVPDAVRAFDAGKALEIRKPNAVRPWQHVQEAVRGLLLLTEKLSQQPADFSGAWNLGPAAESAATVRTVCDIMVRAWGEQSAWTDTGGDGIPEAGLLMLDSTKAAQRLDWQNLFTLEEALGESMDWYKAALRGADMAAFTAQRLQAFAAKAKAI
ncbi:CDP-glucose 4,6-dehydratase [Ferrovibrio sp.]|uniref:CDP-glucose 4,6-dehydratase n=1 Tax=Ferrovibrio sp. TaxID=1917215 RepID=UPI0035B41BB3